MVMSTLMSSDVIRRKPWLWMAGAFVLGLALAGMALPNLFHSRVPADESSRALRQRLMESEVASNLSNGLLDKAKPAAMIASDARVELSVDQSTGAAAQGADDRKMVRTISLEMVVQHPGLAAEQIRALAERLGGFLVSSEVSGGQDATSGSLTVRVPAGRYEDARAEIRKLGLRVESEKVEAQDVTRQYVDEDANLRNLRAEEAQYLSILKQAHTVKDTMEVTGKLSEVRGQIEQQQAEFDTLSKQIETVAITVSLRAEAEAQVFGLHWRPLYQMKLALRDGLDGVANYGATMTAIVFYLPAVVLWLATILVGAAVAWRVVRWVGRRMFGWQGATASH
jgi:hypothetical protein